MSIILFLSLCSPSKRRLTFERWKRTRADKVIAEIGFGIFGIAALAGLLYLLFVYMHR